MKTVLFRFVTGLVTVLAATTASATVSVDEIIRLHTAGLSDHSLLLVVSASDTPDTLSTAQLTQMIEAQVPDTVISSLVAKADAVMEDWQPVNLEEEMKGRNVYTDTEVHYVYPEWGGWYGYGGWGWCGTPWYGWSNPWYGYGCATPYSGLYVGYGYGGGWSVGINFGWGYGYCAPYYGGGYYGGGYCGYADPWPGYDPYPGHGGDPYDSYRVVDRVDYHSGPSRSEGRSAPGTPYRQDAPADTRTDLSSVEGRRIATVDRGGNTTNGKSVRDQGGVPATRSSDDLTRLTEPGSAKSTLNSADRGAGRYVIKGDEKKLRENSGTTGRSLETVGRKAETGTSAQTPSARSISSEKGKVVRGLESGTEQRTSELAGQVTERSRNVASKATGAESVGDQVNRYVRMKEAQRSTGGSRGSRSNASSTRLAEAPSSTPAQRSTSTSGSQRQVQRAEGSKAPAKITSSTPSSTPRAVSPKGGQRSGGSFKAPARSGGTSSGGGSRGAGMKSGGGSGSRGGRR